MAHLFSSALINVVVGWFVCWFIGFYYLKKKEDTCFPGLEASTSKLVKIVGFFWLFFWR